MRLGIIVDTFSELRDEKFEIEDDMSSRCFICSLPADEFDRTGTSRQPLTWGFDVKCAHTTTTNAGGGFSNHVKYEHNMWAYLFFLNYLDLKDDELYTAHEVRLLQMRACDRNY